MKHIVETGVASTLEKREFGAGKPVIAFTAGVHGDEVTGVFTARRLIEHLEKHPPQRGTVRVFPAVTPAAVRCLARRSPFDKADLNRLFPGDAEGSVSMRVAAAVWEETADADAIVDLHCCSQYLVPYILSIYDEIAALPGFVRRITLPVAIRSEGTPGQLFTEACRRRGQTACIIELPSGASDGVINKADSDKCFFALLDFLRSYGVAGGDVKGEAPKFYGRLTDGEAPRAGLWTPALEKGALIKRGEVVGTLEQTPVTAPADALLMAIQPMSYLFEEQKWAFTYAEEWKEA